VILTNVSVAGIRSEATERATECLGREWDSIDDHSHFSEGHLNAVHGYESHDEAGTTDAGMKDPACGVSIRGSPNNQRC
jgi:hypothetical protein